MSEKNSKTINFIKKNVYYFVFIVCLAVLSVITIALVVTSNSKPVNGGNTIEKPNNDNSDNGNNNAGNENQGNENKPNDENQGNEDQNGKEEEQKPVVSVIVFDIPVNGTIIKDYVATGVVYNQTLNLYSGHKAIDFAADEGTSVKAVYQGTVENIVTSKLEGTTLTIDHGNGLKTVYNSIEVDESISIGTNVSKGDVIGSVSTNNKLEYLDGAHLHFEVLENGEKIDPYKYLLTEEK